MTNHIDSPWTEEKVALLRDGYHNLSIRVLADMLNLSRSAVKSKAERLRLQKSRPVWTEERDVLLRELWLACPMEEIIARVGSTRSAVQERARALKLQHKSSIKWPSDKEDVLRELWPTHSASCIAEKMGITAGSVIGKAHRLGLLQKGVRSHLINVVKRIPAPSNRPGGFSRRSHPTRSMSRYPAIPVIPLGISFFDLNQQHCRWPVEEPDQEMKYCGHQVLDGRSYCVAHYCMVYQPTNQRVRALLLVAA